MRKIIVIPLALLAAGAVAAQIGRQWSSSDEESAAATLWLAPSDVDFGRTLLGEPVTLPVIVTNAGDEPLVLDEVVAESPFSAAFPALTLAPGVALEIPVTFDPAEPGEFRGILRVKHEGARPSEVALRGVGEGPPKLALTPRNLAFGDVEVGGVLRAILTVANQGQSALELTANSTDPSFQPAYAARTVEPGESVPLEVLFQPEQEGEVRTQLWIGSNEPGRKGVAVPLVGRGVFDAPKPSLQVSTSALEFGDVAVGQTARRRLTLRNAGAGPLTISSVSLQEPFQSSTRSRTLAAGAALLLPVLCAPGAPGAHFAPLVLTSNDPTDPLQSVALLCNGVAGQVIASSSSTGSGSRERGSGIAGGGASRSLSSGGADASGADAGDAGDAATQSAFSEGAASDSGGEALTGQGSEAAEGEQGSSDDGVGDDPLGGGGPGLAEQSEVYLATFAQPISDLSHSGVVFDQGTGMLQIQNLQLPTVDGGINGYYEFDPVTVQGLVTQLGEFEAVIPIRFKDGQGAVTDFLLNLTTDTAVVAFNNREVAFPGSPLTGEAMTIVGAAQVPYGPLKGQMFQVTLDVNVQ
jgi:hypothetical protein